MYLRIGSDFLCTLPRCADLVWNQETDVSILQLDTLIRMIAQENASAIIYLSSILPIWNEDFQRVLDYNAAIEELVQLYKEEGLPGDFVDNFEGFDLSKDAKGDLVNPYDGSGSEKIANKFGDALQTLCCQSSALPELGTCAGACGKAGIGKLQCWYSSFTSFTFLKLCGSVSVCQP